MNCKTFAAANAILFALAMSVGTAAAQTSAPAITDDFTPSSLNQPGQQYPQVNPKVMRASTFGAQCAERQRQLGPRWKRRHHSHESRRRLLDGHNGRSARRGLPLLPPAGRCSGVKNW